MDNKESLTQLMREQKADAYIRLLALDRAIPLCHNDHEYAIRIAKMFEAYLNGETV